MKPIDFETILFDQQSYYFAIYLCKFDHAAP